MLASKKEIECECGTKKTKFSIPELSNQLFLLLSSRCQMNCIYCYASSKTLGRDMTYETATTAIDFLVKNVLFRKKRQGGDVGYITFHGGGEPCINMSLLRSVVDYAETVFRSNGVKLTINILTNGCLTNEEDIVWVANHINNIQISLDGNEDCQDYQRPLRNGKGSYFYVDSMIEMLCKVKKNFSIHATVTEYNEGSLVAFVEDIKNRYSACKELVLSPLHSGGRADEGKIGGAVAYGEVYKKIETVLRNTNIALVGPCVKAGKNKQATLCDAALFKTITVTPDGKITFCHETMNNSSFFIGEVTSLGMSFDSNRIEDLKNQVRGMQQRERCKECPSYDKCRGGCLVDFSSKCELKEILSSIYS